MVYYSGGTGLLDPIKIFNRLGIRDGMKIGDFGCGSSGYFPLSAARMVGNTGMVYAVDIMKSTLHEVSKKARLEGMDNIKIIWSNLEIYRGARVKDNYVDLGLLVNVLFQSKEYENIMKECTRMIKKGGKLLIIDWKNSKTAFGPPAVDRVDSAMVKNIAQKIGLELVEEFSPGEFHYGLILMK